MIVNVSDHAVSIRMKLLTLFFVSFIAAASADYSSKDLRCLICKAVVEEMDKEIAQISPTRMVKLGGYTIDALGNNVQREVPYIESTVFLVDLMDNVCQKMDNYVRAKFKTNGKLTLLKLMTDDGKMNPNISSVDVISDSDLNKSLQYHCEGIVEEFENEFFYVFGSSKPKIPHENVCTTHTKLCDLDAEKDEL